MPTLSFDGETHDEIVAKVKRWLASIEGQEDRRLSAAEAVHATANLTKEALKVIASSAPAPVAQSEIVRGLTGMGYSVTESTANAVVDALDSLSAVTGDAIVRRVREGSQSAIWQMNQAVAKQLLQSLRRPKKG